MTQAGDSRTLGTEAMRGILLEAARAVHQAFDAIPVADRRRPGNRPGQYYIDLVADEAMCDVLHRAGLRVLSEESGVTGPGDGEDFLVVADPIDGSTNASLGIPWFATSLCVLDGQGMLLSLVVNHAHGTVYEAERGGGATCNGRPIAPSTCESLPAAVVAISGFPDTRPRWGQFRALGAASLDICAVAGGVLDAYAVVGSSSLWPWDYLGALLVCREAGAESGEGDGRELVEREAVPRRPMVAGTGALLAALRDVR
ncbi:MAG: inositol monophosphatase family protein [Acidimicrobiales bacterium]